MTKDSTNASPDPSLPTAVTEVIPASELFEDGVEPDDGLADPGEGDS